MSTKVAFSAHRLPSSTATNPSMPVFSCTCGECTDGWLSPRMRYRLLSEANSAVDMMKMSLESPLASDLECAPGTEYLSPTVQKRGVTRPFYVGYTAVVMVIAKLLKQSGDEAVPCVKNVDAMARRLSRHTTVFFDRGGRVRNAIDFILQSAKDQSPLVDGTWDEMRAEEAEDGEGEEYGKLPRCANDLDFTLVKAGLADE